MKPCCYYGILCAGAVLFAITPPIAVGQPPGGRVQAKVAAPRPRQPGGILRDELGVYLTIEGVRADAGKSETGTLLVDTVDGNKLEKPIAVLIRISGYPINRLDLPARKRCVLKGYESGEMIGIAPAIYAAAAEQGRTETDVSSKDFMWRPYFVALVVAEPKGLEIPK